MIHADIIIVGSGITGTAAARELSRYDASVLVLDRGPDVAEGATKANSGIVHAGYDAVPGTKKAYYNVRGSMMFQRLCCDLSVPYRKCGALVIGFNEQDRRILQQLLERGLKNGVHGLELLSPSEALRLEPSLNPEVCCALNVPESAIVSPYELAFALADEAALNGVRFCFNQEVTDIVQNGKGLWQLQTQNGEIFACRAVLNCAGPSGAALHNLISDVPLRMVYRRGQYYLLDRSPACPFSRTIFQCPTAMGKGVLVTPTVHGNTLIGPNAESIDDPMDTATTSEGLDSVMASASRTWPSLSVRSNITNFSGIRAHLEGDDFMIGPVSGALSAFEAIGIESPGLSSAPAIALDLASMISDHLSLRKKESFTSLPPAKKPFSEMTDDERASALSENPEYGNIVCRCETVTEAEIRHALRRPVSASTIDGVKRRTRAGMGRCQGGFCCPRVAEIISEETGIPIAAITKNGGGSRLLSGSVGAFLSGGDGI